jgi:Family of unknown function (DUF5906)
MSDDNEYPTEEELDEALRKTNRNTNVVQFPKNDEVTRLESNEAIIKYYNQFYCRGPINGKLFIVGEKLKNKLTFSTRKDFIEILEEDERDVVTTAPNGNITTKKQSNSLIWLKSKLASSFDDMVFDCRLPVGLHNRIYNLWRGFATDARQGNCNLTFAYIKDIICYNNDDIYNWVLNFLAHMVQKPWEKPEVALVLVGPKGVGKTFFMDIVKTLIDGKDRHFHCFKTSNPNDIYGDFTEHLRNLIALLLEEVTWGGDIRHIGKLNDLITGKTITINIKRGPIITVNNVMRIIMGGNPGWKVPASYDERRYQILNVSTAHQQDHSYFAPIQNELNNGGYEALMYELAHRDVSKFNFREAIVTEALIDQIMRGAPLIEQWWVNILKHGNIRFVERETNDWICVSRDSLYNNYCMNMKKIGSRQILLQKDEFGIKLREFLPLINDNNVVHNVDGRRILSIVKQKRVGKLQIYCHLLPPLIVCRELWDFRLKGKRLDWDDSAQWELPELDEF